MSEFCNACGAPKAADGFKACEDCRRVWRLAQRKPGGPADIREALTALVDEIDGLHGLGALHPSGFARLQRALWRARKALADRGRR